MSAEKNNKKQIIILGVLGVVLVAVLGNSVLGGKKPTAQAKQTGAKTSTKTTDAALEDGKVASVFQKVDVDLDQLVQEIKVVEFEYELERDDRDPTLPLVGDSMLLRARTAVVGGEVDPEDLMFAAQKKKVTGIIWDEANPLAVIDNDVVAVGFTFEEPIFVKSIERDRVILGITGQDAEVVRELIKEQ